MVFEKVVKVQPPFSSKTLLSKTAGSSYFPKNIRPERSRRAGSNESLNHPTIGA
jgi:hypothetical protein